MRPLQIKSSKQNSQLTSKKKRSTYPHQKQLKLSPVSENSNHSLQTRYAFPTHLQARKLWPQTYSLSLLNWSQVICIPTSTKIGGIYKVEKLSILSVSGLKFHQRHENATGHCIYKVPHDTSKWYTPPLLIPVATMEKCKQANEFQ